MRNILLTIFILLFVLFVITGCEKWTASLDKVSAEEVTVAPEPTPETEIPEQEPAKVNSAAESNEDITGNIVAEIEEPQSKVHIVKMTADGFSPNKLYIKPGDTVEWKNVRSGTINKAMIIGVRECSKVRSGFFKPGESFSWTFDQQISCTFADGVLTTAESKVIVE